LTDVPREVSNFFLAMQAGKTGAAALAACFDDEAVYVEPFSGTLRRHEGKQAIMRAMQEGWEFPMPDRHITIDTVKAAGAEISVAWTCYASVLPGGRGSGVNRFRMRDGLIVSLETTLREGSGNGEDS